MFKKLLIDKINKNHFFLISLFALLFIGTPGLNKSIYIFHITLILLFIKFELSITRLIISISASIFLIIFVKELNNIDIAFIISLILFSFNFDEQKVKLKNNLTFNLLFFVCFILIIGKLMSPNAKNYLVTWEIANYDSLAQTNKLFLKDMKLQGILEPKDLQKYIDKKFLNKKEYMDTKIILDLREFPRYIEGFFSNQPKPPACDYFVISEDSKELLPFNCTKSNKILKTRYKINTIDSNYTAIILLLVSFLFSLQIKNERHQFFIFFSLILIISYITKSRTTVIFFLCYLIYFYFKNFVSFKNIFLTYIIVNILVVFLGFLALNSVVDANNIWHPEKDGASLLPVTNSSYSNEIFRYLQLFDSSNYIRFTRNFQSYLVIINNFSEVLFPENYLTINSFEYETYRNSVHNFSVKDYHPHNFFFYSVKEFGLVLTLIYHFNLFYLIYKYSTFKEILFPLLFVHIFLGTHLLLIIHVVLLFSFKSQNNLYVIYKKFKNIS